MVFIVVASEEKKDVRINEFTRYTKISGNRVTEENNQAV